MAEKPDAQPPQLGIYDRPENSGLTGLEIAAIVFSLLWLGLAGYYMFAGDVADGAGMQFIMNLMVVVLPIAMIWVAATAARASRVMREESARLQVAIEAIRKSYVTQSQRGAGDGYPTISKKLDEIAAAQKKAETTLAMFSSTRTAFPTAAPRPENTAAPGDDDQQMLALGTTVEDITPPLPVKEFIRALNFPETTEDEEGFAALRRALKHRQTGQLVQASQDVLTLLSQDGIYMDDLRPDLARPEIWRKFAKGERGRTVAALGGIRDRSSLALTAARMKQDPIFRDAAHHFLRVFDKSFVGFEENASDTELSEFANTRTARAFMLLGRVAGTFD
ncbi:hypothetical protein VK792_08280 [Mesobacterium sp. TK19101]|uniref:Uncharacterized protein n=1 Tax=Mesobacterium hydrothermale TaxID=3111907 RepID=A0ABU6HIL9_9RHOB|nr:hypothetical protein [Mesobacterium sp. TK19101]MEC3861278.1 hypothetical protein [Mesobacterium sp. TK19101]